MSTRTDERQRGVILHLIDFSDLLAQVPTEGEETADVGFGSYAMTELADGRLYVVCNEGVGWEVTDDEPLEVDLYVSDPDHIAIMPRYRTSLTPAEVRAAATGGEVDLADHVRRFGGRLEDNFRIWHRKLG